MSLEINDVLNRDINDVIDRMEDVWQELRGERIFITGGTGFFGCSILKMFLQANGRLDLGAKAWVLSRDPDKFVSRIPWIAKNPAIELIQGDVRLFQFPAGDFHSIIHGATDISTAPGIGCSPWEELNVAVDGTQHVLEFSVQAKCKKLLYISSGAVYGKQPYDMETIPESYLGGPNTTDIRSIYAEGKRMGELLCILQGNNSQMQVKIARGFAFIGPYLPLDAHFAIGNFIRDAMQGGPILVNGDGTVYRSYLYGSELAEWLWTILVRGSHATPYNVGSESAFSIADVAREVANCFPKPVDVKIAQIADPLKKPDRYIPTTTKALNELGLKQRVGLREAIMRTIDWNHGLLERDKNS